MIALRFLYAAYAATWAIHAVYMGTLVRRHKKVQQEWRELEKQ